MKFKIYLGFLLFTMLAQSVYAESAETNICIKNTTAAPHQINVANIRNYDWDGDSRPDKNFSGLVIAPGQTICKREETNTYAAEKGFTFLIDGAPSKMEYRVTQYNRGIGNKPSFYSDPQWFVIENEINPLRLHGEKTISIQPESWKLGYKCSPEYIRDQRCRLFEIR